MISEPLPWLELNLLESGWCFLVILTAAVIRGYSGFGFSALTVAGLTLILPPTEVIPIAFLLEIGASIHMLLWSGKTSTGNGYAGLPWEC